jgi:TldD protein
MREKCQRALDVARGHGASYADVRLIELRREDLVVLNGKVAETNFSDELGMGIRVIVNGAWGFASCPDLDSESIINLTRRACEIAQAGASACKATVQLSDIKSYQDTWCTPMLQNPFKVPLETRLDLLMSIDERLRRDSRITRAQSSMNFLKEKQYFASTEGSWIIQELVRTGSGYCATAVQDGEMQIRSYPMAFGGMYKSGGYELITSSNLLENADRVRDEAIALTTAPVCPSAETDLILMPSQLCLQIHESVGHPNELDRVLGWEADFAGTSFNLTDNQGQFRYGSDLVNLVADNTVPGGLATQGYDDDGVPAQRWHIVQNGLFVDYFTTRDSAPFIQQKSNGCNRAEGWSHVPITRIPNLSLMPGEGTLDELIEDTKDGVLMDTNKSWSIDQRRLNFQFGCEAAWEIKNGKKGRLLRNPNYQDMTPRFWRSCDAICNHDEWELIGIANCGKGQPGQTAEMSHGCSPARFKGVTVGVKA